MKGLTKTQKKGLQIARRNVYVIKKGLKYSNEKKELIKKFKKVKEGTPEYDNILLRTKYIDDKMKGFSNEIISFPETFSNMFLK